MKVEVSAEFRLTERPLFESFIVPGVLSKQYISSCHIAPFLADIFH